MFVAAQAGVGLVDWKGKANPLVEAVREISIDGRGRELTPEERELEAMRGPMVAESWDADPRNPKNRRRDPSQMVVLPDGDALPAWLVQGDDVADDNQAGSYEALMRGWGGDTGRAAFGTELLQGG